MGPRMGRKALFGGLEVTKLTGIGTRLVDSWKVSATDREGRDGAKNKSFLNP